MAAAAKKTATRTHVATAPLSKQYREIGPASVAAALLFMRKAKSSTKSA